MALLSVVFSQRGKVATSRLPLFFSGGFQRAALIFCFFGSRLLFDVFPIFGVESAQIADAGRTYSGRGAFVLCVCVDCSLVLKLRADFIVSFFTSRACLKLFAAYSQSQLSPVLVHSDARRFFVLYLPLCSIVSEIFDAFSFSILFLPFFFIFLFVFGL